MLLNRTELERLYKNVDKTLDELSREICISTTWLTRLLKKYNIPRNRQNLPEYRRLMSERLKELYRNGYVNPMKGKPHTEEVKRILSVKAKERFRNERSPMYGKHLSEETKRKLSQTLTGRKCPWMAGDNSPMRRPEVRAKISAKLRGRKLTPEWIEKSRKARSGVNHPFYGKHRSEEIRLKVRNGVLEFLKKNPDLKKKWVKKSKKAMKNPEVKLKMSLAQKKRFQLNPDTHPNVIMARNQTNKGFISKQQKSLFETVKTRFSDASLNYPIVTSSTVYFADVCIPSQKIDIEYDGKFWHKDKSRDTIRDEELRKTGWKVIRVNENSFEKFLKGVNNGEYLRRRNN